MPVVELDTPLGKLSLNIQCLGLEPAGPLGGSAAGAVDVSIASSSLLPAGPSGPASASEPKKRKLSLGQFRDLAKPESSEQHKICEICCKAFLPKKAFYTVCSWDCFCTRRELKSMNDTLGQAADSLVAAANARAAQNTADGGAYGSQ